jgi:hypothetical protein
MKNLLIWYKEVNPNYRLAFPQFFLLFAIGLDKPLSKASSGQTISNILNRPRHRQAGCKNFRAETF